MEEAESRIYTVFGDNRETIDCCMSIGSYEENFVWDYAFRVVLFLISGEGKRLFSHLLSGRR